MYRNLLRVIHVLLSSVDLELRLGPCGTVLANLIQEQVHPESA